MELLTAICCFFTLKSAVWLWAFGGVSAVPDAGGLFTDGLAWQVHIALHLAFGLGAFRVARFRSLAICGRIRRVVIRDIRAIWLSAE